MMFETLKYLDRHFLVRGISHRWQQQQYIMSKMEEIEAVESVFIGGSENQQSHKSGSSDIIMTRDFFYFCFCRVFFRKIVGSQVYNLNENFAFATNRGRRIFLTSDDGTLCLIALTINEDNLLFVTGCRRQDVFSDSVLIYYSNSDFN